MITTDPFAPAQLDDDKLHEECGVFGVYGHPDAANLSFLGLYALQHRGQESAGIATYKEEFVNVKRGKGLLTKVFDKADFNYFHKM